MADHINTAAVEGQDFKDVDHFAPEKQSKLAVQRLEDDTAKGQTFWSAEKLSNGKWACNHKCKDKAVLVPPK